MIQTDELKKIAQLKREIMADEERLLRLRSRIEGCTAILDGLPKGSNDHDYMADIVSRMMELEKRISAAVLERELKINDMETYLCSVTPRQAEMARLRYFEGLKWGDVAARMGIDERSARALDSRLHK